MPAILPPDIYERFGATLAKTEWASREHLDQYRDILLKRLLAFAYAQSPFYRQRLQPLFRYGDAPRLDAWHEIPLLRRSDLENHVESINAREVPDEMGEILPARTSGSTGNALSFRTCMLARMAEECMKYRHFCWHDLDFTASMANVRPLNRQARYPEGETDYRWIAQRPGAPHYKLTSDEPVANIIAWLSERSPRYLMTMPSVMYDIAQHSDVSKVAAINIQKIIGVGESLPSYIRTAVEQRFGCKIAQIYGTGEVGGVALQSPCDASYLVCDETVYLEVLKDDGSPAQPGEQARVVLTSLYNYATPFIRYEIGDYATLAVSPCSSGRSLTRLQQVHGRGTNALRTIDDRRVWPDEILFTELAGQLRCRRFQVRQLERNKIDILLTGQTDPLPPDHSAVALTISRFLGIDCKIDIRYVGDLPRTSSGKRELVLSMVN